MATVTIEAQEITVATDVLALRGDTLLIFNGVCVGTREGRAAPPKNPKAATNKPVEYVSTEVVLSAIERMGQGGTREVCDFLGLDRKDHTRRCLVSKRLDTLRKTKRIAIVPDTGRKLHHIYQVRQPAALNGAAHA